MIDLIKRFLKEAIGQSKDIDIEVMLSEKEEYGHYFTNEAFKLAPILKKSPMETARNLEFRIKNKELSIFERVEAV